VTLEIVFVAGRLLPAFGGGERYALELLGSLAARHRVRAVWLQDERAHGAAITMLPAGVEGTQLPRVLDTNSTRRRRRRQAVLRDAVQAAFTTRPFDVVIGQVGAETVAGPVSHELGVPGVFLLPAYDSLCRFAFVPGNGCRPSSNCLGCSLGGRRISRRRLADERTARLAGLGRCALLVAPSHSVAGVYTEWTGLRPAVVAPVCGPARPATADPRGHLLVAVSSWSREKGRDLLEPLARALPDRRLVVSRRFLPGALVRRLRALGNVDLAGHAPIAELMEGAAATLVPSRWPEPFGRVAFESMSAGVPVLASATGGLVELVPKSQLVDPPASLDAWVSGIRALEDRDRWEAARGGGARAAETILASDPVGRFEQLLLDAVRRCRTTMKLPT
jgi:glycosyltransferase involved in cell wall biosynthesis